MTDDLKQKIIQAIKENADPHQPPPAKPRKALLYKVATLAAVTTLCAVIFIQLGSALFAPVPPTGPWGKISSPSPGSVTGHDVRVTAETGNMEPGQYVWLAVDKPKLGLCWPKIQVEGNTDFKTVITENGPEEPYSLSLYAVNKTVHDQWQGWLKKKRHGGLPMLHESRRLDSVRLIYGG